MGVGGITAKSQAKLLWYIINAHYSYIAGTINRKDKKSNMKIGTIDLK